MRFIRVLQSRIWDIVTLIFVIAAVAVFTRGDYINGVQDMPLISAPSAPTAGIRIYGDTSTGKLACIDSSEQDCMPAGGGGGGGTGAIGFVISGGGQEITTGLKGCVVAEFNATITSATLVADQAGSIVIDIWKDTYANYQPTVDDSITASAKPTLSSAIKSKDSTLTGWTKTITAGDVLCANVDSASTVTWVSLSLAVTK